MRVNVPTNPDGAPIISHMQVRSDQPSGIPVQRADDGTWFIDVPSRHHFIGLITGAQGALWERANPNK